MSTTDQVKELSHRAQKNGFIWFSDSEPDEVTAFLSNFYSHQMLYNNFSFSCAESAYQAQKFVHIPHIFYRFLSLTGKEAWLEAEANLNNRRADWPSAHTNTMYVILLEKFQSNKALAKKLLATGNAYIVEHSSRDYYWADGGDGRGFNKLGQMLMYVRQKLNGKKPKQQKIPQSYIDFIRAKNKISQNR